MDPMPLNALRAFAAVYAQGGVRAAARELGVAHSAVSRHLAELEDWLGVPLIRTSGGRRGLLLTEDAEALGRATVAGLQEIERAVASLREARSAKSVTIATSPSLAARWLLPRLQALETADPLLEVSVLVDQRVVDVDEGEVDVAIRMGRGPWKDGRSESLMDDALFPVMSRAFWERSGKPRHAADLTRLRLLHDRDPSTSWERWRDAHGPEGLDTRSGPRFASSDLVLRAAALGKGVALARQRLVEDDLASGALLRPLGESSVPLPRAYWLVLPRGRPPRDATQAVVAWLKDQARSSAP